MVDTYPPFNRQIEKFNTLAKLTQAKYGTISQPAIFEHLKNATAVTTVECQNY